MLCSTNNSGCKNELLKKFSTLHTHTKFSCTSYPSLFPPLLSERVNFTQSIYSPPPPIYDEFECMNKFIFVGLLNMYPLPECCTIHTILLFSCICEVKVCLPPLTEYERESILHSVFEWTCTKDIAKVVAQNVN